MSIGHIETVWAALELPAAALRVEAAPPLLVSQRTSETVLGLTGRRYLEALPAFEGAGGEVLRLGRLRLVAPQAFIRWLRQRPAPSPSTADGADRLASELGLRPAGARPESGHLQAAAPIPAPNGCPLVEKGE